MATFEQCEARLRELCTTYEDYNKFCSAKSIVCWGGPSVEQAIHNTTQSHFGKGLGDKLSRSLGLPTTDERQRLTFEGGNKLAAEANEIARESNLLAEQANRHADEANDIAIAAQSQSGWALWISIAAGVTTLLGLLNEIFGIVAFFKRGK